MKKNMGLIDRLIRTVFAIIVGILYFKGMITGTAAIILGIFAVVFLATSAIGFCPLYLPLGINTCKK
jgi:hypothetical protein